MKNRYYACNSGGGVIAWQSIKFAQFDISKRRADITFFHRSFRKVVNIN